MGRWDNDDDGTLDGTLKNGTWKSGSARIPRPGHQRGTSSLDSCFLLPVPVLVSDGPRSSGPCPWVIPATHCPAPHCGISTRPPSGMITAANLGFFSSTIQCDGSLGTDSVLGSGRTRLGRRRGAASFQTVAAGGFSGFCSPHDAKPRVVDEGLPSVRACTRAPRAAAPPILRSQRLLAAGCEAGLLVATTWHCTRRPVLPRRPIVVIIERPSRLAPSAPSASSPAPSPEEDQEGAMSAHKCCCCPFWAASPQRWHAYHATRSLFVMRFWHFAAR